jgi:hypothetical protein
MNFPPFWARAKKDDFVCWRWSFNSVAEAEALAAQALEQLMARIKSGDIPRSTHGGYYPNRPFREQIMREIKNAAGEIAAVITRNSYGCLVLNTARVMFVDIDLPEPKKKRGGLFSRLFGKPQITPPGHAQSEAVARVENWTRDNFEWGWRVYKTRLGLRLLATQGLVEAKTEIADRVFEALGADPLYRKLCRAQQCFRARLTPKPWRCGLPDKPPRWPWVDAKREQRFQKWQAEYQSCSADWATCEFVKHIGNPTVHPDVQAIVELHDEPTRAGSKLPLA